MGSQLGDSVKASAEETVKHRAALARYQASKNSELAESREQYNLDVLAMQKHHQAKLHAHEQSKDEEMTALKGTGVKP